MSEQRPGGQGGEAEATEELAGAADGEGGGGAESLLGQLCDIVRYAPIAIVLDGPALLPKLAEQGKVHMANARVLGPRALRQLEPQARRLLDDVGATAGELLKRFGLLPEAGPPPEAPAPRPRTPRARPVLVTAEPAASRNGEVPAIDTGPAVDELAITDYDSLPAAHVLNRLPALTPDELEAVRRYEAGHRGRKTILNKVAQLQQAS
jgi:hypothetical protein